MASAFGFGGLVFIVALVLSLFPVKQRDSMFGMIVRRSRWILLFMIVAFVGGLALLSYMTLPH